MLNYYFHFFKEAIFFKKNDTIHPKQATSTVTHASQTQTHSYRADMYYLRILFIVDLGYKNQPVRFYYYFNFNHSGKVGGGGEQQI